MAEQRTQPFGELMQGRSHGEREQNVGDLERMACVIGGGLLAVAGLRRLGSFGGLLVTAGGTALAVRGLSGHCPVYARMGIDHSQAVPRGISLHRTVTVERPPEDIYRFWRELSNLPHLLSHVESVTARGDREHHWVARTGPLRLEWTTEITEDRPPDRMAWRSLAGSPIQTEGAFWLKRAPGDRGTEVHLELRFWPPGGRVAAALAPLFRLLTGKQIDQDLYRMRQVLEAGELATNRIRAEGPEEPARREAAASESWTTPEGEGIQIEERGAPAPGESY